MNKLTVTILLVAVAMVAGEAPFRKNRGRFFQRQEVAPANPEYGAPAAPEYGPPDQGTDAAAGQQGGYQYPTPETPFEDGDNSGAPETAPQSNGYLPPQTEEPQAERFRVQPARSGKLQKLRQSAVPVLTFVPAAEYYRLFQ